MDSRLLELQIRLKNLKRGLLISRRKAELKKIQSTNEIWSKGPVRHEKALKRIKFLERSLRSLRKVDLEEPEFVNDDDFLEMEISRVELEILEINLKKSSNKSAISRYKKSIRLKKGKISRLNKRLLQSYLSKELNVEIPKRSGYHQWLKDTYKDIEEELELDSYDYNRIFEILSRNDNGWGRIKYNARKAMLNSEKFKRQYVFYKMKMNKGQKISYTEIEKQWKELEDKQYQNLDNKPQVDLTNLFGKTYAW